MGVEPSQKARLPQLPLFSRHQLHLNHQILEMARAYIISLTDTVLEHEFPDPLVCILYTYIIISFTFHELRTSKKWMYE